MDHDTGNVLYSVNADRLSYPASLTKVMTMYLLFDAFESGKVNLNTRLKVSQKASQASPSKLALRPGETISAEDAVLALVTKSANDVAIVVAEHLGGTEAKFGEMMTRKAHQLGMTNTTYRNASGLPNLQQKTTARDQAHLARALIRNHGKYYHYFSTRHFSWKGQNISSHNRLMSAYQGADGIKTGYINASGFNLMSSAKRDGVRLIGIVFGGNTAKWRDNNMAQILDKGFARVNRGEDIRSARVEAEDRDEIAKLIAATAEPKPNNTQVRARGPENNAAQRWAIQVGAFKSKQPAQRAAREAAQNLGRLVSNATVNINASNGRNGTTYRARLTGLTEQAARNACQQLAQKKRDCQVIRPTA